MSLEKALLHLVRGAVFLVPLVALLQCGSGDWLFGFLPSTVYLHVTWRNFLFRILVEVMVGLWIVLALRDPRYRPRFSWVVAALAAFVVAMALADAFGIDPERSFFGDFERMEGLIGLLHLLAYTVVAGTVLDRDWLWKVLAGVFLVVCTVVCIDSVIQIVRAVLAEQGAYEGRPFLQPVPQKYQGSVYFRIDARLASPVFLAVYLLFHVFLAAVCAAVSGRRLRWAFVALGLSYAVLMFFTGTRVAIAGMVVGTLVAAGAAMRLHPSDRVRRAMRFVAAAAVLAIVTIGAVMVFDPPVVRDLLPDRFAGGRIVFNLGERATLWGIAWQGFLEHPLLGWGQENFHAVFDRYYDPALYGPEVSPWFDHPHNVFLSWLIAGGLLAFVAYVGIFVAALRGLWRCEVPLAHKCLLTGLLAGYALFNCFELDNLTSYVLLCSLLAYLHAKTARPPVAEARAVGGAVTAVAAVLVAAGVGVAIGQLNLRPLGTAILVHDAHVRPVETGENGRPRLALARALDRGPIGRVQVRELLAKQVVTLDARRWPQLRTEALQLAARELNDEIERQPDNVRALFFLGRMLANAGLQRQALAFLERALELSPRRQALMLKLAEVYLGQGRPRDAIRMFERFHEVTPDLRAGLVTCAVGAIWAGDRAFEEKMLDRLRARQTTTEFRPGPKIVEALLQNGRAETVAELLEPILDHWRKERRDDPSAAVPEFVVRRYFALVRARLQLGEKDEALRLLEEAARLFPGKAEEARAMALQIRKG